jgi:hypothetical protein
VNSGDEEQQATSKESVEKIHSRLLLNFVDVVCLFADDLGGPEAVVDRLTNWIQCRRASHYLPPQKPAVVVVVSSSQARQHTLSLVERIIGFDETFAPLTVVDMTVFAGLSMLSAYISLRGILTREADKARGRRVDLRLLYTATHIKALFVQAVKDFAASPDSGFDFVGATRSGRRNGSKLAPHIQEFLRLARREGISEESLPSFVASAFLMDCYPPGMHCMQQWCV